MFRQYKNEIIFPFHSADPFDNRNAYLRDSKLYPEAGQGMVARVEIPANTNFVMMTGHVRTRTQNEKKRAALLKIMEERNITYNHPDIEPLWKYQ